MQRLLIIYWRVASLLVITIYLLIGSMPVGFLTGFLGSLLIPIGLWFWADLNEEIYEQANSSLKLVFTAWRWAVSIYCVVGAIVSAPFLQCAISQTTFATPFCQMWLDAPFGFKNFFHPNYQVGFVGFLGIVGLIVYVLYFGYFILFRLSRQGRSAAEQ